MNNLENLKLLGLNYINTYYFDDNHKTTIYDKGDTCILIDDNICACTNGKIFDYSKYCEMQNKYFSEYDKVFRFNNYDDTIEDKIKEWLSKTVDDINVTDNGGSFDIIHTDNTPLEANFEDLFCEAYGKDSRDFLKKEYSISLNNGKNAFVDYVIETKNGNYAIEENGVQYHHPCIIGNEQYDRQLEKQNTLSLYNFKVFRFSTQNISFKDQIIDNIKRYLGDKSCFINSNKVKQYRKVKLYDHQKNILENIYENRKSGINTSLVVIPTGTGKSQIVLEDIEILAKKQLIKNILIMVPSLRIKGDWEERIKIFNDYNLNIKVQFYNTVFIEKNTLDKKYYDYIVFDEAHHAQAANCKKTLQYFEPKYLIGLTATPDRLDSKKLEEIFGEYETEITLKEAIEKKVLSNIRCYRVKSNIDLSNIRYNGKDYNYADLEKNVVIDSRNDLIVSTLKKYFSPRDNFYKQGIIFCVNIKHCKKLEKLMNDANFTAKAVYGQNKDNDKIFEDYKNKKTQFLITCQLISEGWDSPQTEIVVMARPTLSKVLYLQQLGRGVRKYPGKECLYVIDVVDNYDKKLRPWNYNAVFHINPYTPFGGVIDGPLEIEGLVEKELTMEEIDIFTFEEKYKGYLSLEQAARELFIGTNTLHSWVKKDPSLSSLSLPIGSKLMPYFSPENIENIRNKKKLTIHNDDTILDDFDNFIDENTLTYSFKLVFMINMLKLADKEGEVNLDDLVQKYSDFYLDRLNNKLPVDRKGCIYTTEYLKDKVKVKKSILDNPFEKFERKRFIYFSKDLNILAFNPSLWYKFNEQHKQEILEKENIFLKTYYNDLGGTNGI